MKLGGAQKAPTLAWRAMTVSDIDRVMAVEVQAYPFPWSRGHFTDSLAAGYLAELQVVGPELIGYFVAMGGVEELHLLNLTVAPPHQGRGHAVALLRRLAGEARAVGALQIWLEVRESNLRARQLYERWGFELAGVRKGYYPAAHGQREHALVMRWPLPGDVGAAHNLEHLPDGLD
jgi:[ribosomal protein S18]-alanine N-acetyltransferase